MTSAPARHSDNEGSCSPTADASGASVRAGPARVRIQASHTSTLGEPSRRSANTKRGLGYRTHVSVTGGWLQRRRFTSCDDRPGEYLTRWPLNEEAASSRPRSARHHLRSRQGGSRTARRRFLAAAFRPARDPVEDPVGEGAMGRLRRSPPVRRRSTSIDLGGTSTNHNRREARVTVDLRRRRAAASCAG